MPVAGGKFSLKGEFGGFECDGAFVQWSSWSSNVFCRSERWVLYLFVRFVFGFECCGNVKMGKDGLF